MTGLAQYTILMVVGWASGISIYLTVALLGVSGRMGWIDLPSGLEILSHPLVIATAVLMYLVEFFADKIPYLDTAWDTLHTFIRPTGAFAVGFLAGTDHGPLAQTVFAILTGTIALDAHAVKSSARMAINTSPEPVSNIAMSVAEHSFVFFLFWLFVKHPVIAFTLVLILIVVSFFVIRTLWRFILKLFKKQESGSKTEAIPK